MTVKNSAVTTVTITFVICNFRMNSYESADAAVRNVHCFPLWKHLQLGVQPQAICHTRPSDLKLPQIEVPLLDLETLRFENTDTTVLSVVIKWLQTQ